MIKIKDNVDLKELEKFGFDIYIIEPQNQPQLKVVTYCKANNIDIYGDEIIEYNSFVFPRRVILKNHSIKTCDILYDLIQAGLVEKVEE